MIKFRPLYMVNTNFNGDFCIIQMLWVLNRWTMVNIGQLFQWSGKRFYAIFSVYFVYACVFNIIHQLVTVSR